MTETTETTETNTNEFTLDDIYFKDAFTQTVDKLNLEVDNATVACITSKDNKFSLDENGNLVVNSITYNESNIPDVLSFNQIYPVGSIYLSTMETNPSTIFGGTWIQIKDRFLLAAGDTYNAGVEAGEAEHTLTINEMPAHTHAGYGATRSTNTGSPYFYQSNIQGYWFENNTDKSTGGSKPHNNMPPYLTVYMWKRTA